MSNTGIQDSSTATLIFLACYSSFKMVTQALATLQVAGGQREERKVCNLRLRLLRNPT